MSFLPAGELLFADRSLLVVLLPLYGLWLAAWFFGPRLAARLRGPRPAAALEYSSVDRVRPTSPSVAVRLRRLVEGLRLLVVALLLLAMARPQTGEKLTTVTTEGVDIVLVLDTSGSMRALDLDADQPLARRRNRLEVAKAVVEDFVARRGNDPIGLVVFGAEAFTQCPLTLDHGVVVSLLAGIDIGIAGDATAIGSALGTAVKRLRDSQAKSRIAILLTDGRNNAGPLDPQKAAEVAKTFGIKVYTIAVGTRDRAPFRVETPLGPRYQYEHVEIDEETLKAIAEITGGTFFRAEEAGALAAIYGEIDRLEKSEITTESYTEYEEQFPWLVLPAVGLLLLEVGLLNTRFRKLP